TIFIGGKEGVKSFSFQNGAWSPPINNESIIENHSFGELSLADISKDRMLLAGVEPMHGNQVTIYLAPYEKTESDQLKRIALDESLKEGHRLVTGDCLGNGTVQIVAGWRVPNEAGEMGIKLYEPVDDSYTKFRTHWIDHGDMA